MKHVRLEKPGLSEIFAALKGVRCAGFSQINSPESTSHPLVELGIEAIELSHDVRTQLSGQTGVYRIQSKNPQTKRAIEDIDSATAAGRCLQFLALAQKRLEPYRDVHLAESRKRAGGTVGDLIEHIAHLAEFEDVGKDRPVASITLAGDIVPPFKTDYLPGEYRARKASSKRGVTVAPSLSATLDL